MACVAQAPPYTPGLPGPTGLESLVPVTAPYCACGADSQQPLALIVQENLQKILSLHPLWYLPFSVLIFWL